MQGTDGTQGFAIDQRNKYSGVVSAM